MPRPKTCSSLAIAKRLLKKYLSHLFGNPYQRWPETYFNRISHDIISHGALSRDRCREHPAGFSDAWQDDAWKASRLSRFSRDGAKAGGCHRSHCRILSRTLWDRPSGRLRARRAVDIGLSKGPEKNEGISQCPKDEEIIFTRGATESINLAAYSFGKAFVKPGDEILISAMEHHSNIVPWQILCEDRGAVLKVIPMNEQGELLLDEYAKLLNSRTRLVAVTHVSNALGTLNPIKEITAIAHGAGTKVLVDGAQSAPHMKIDVQDSDVDFFAFSGHKMMGPTGIGILYGKAASSTRCLLIKEAGI